MLWGDKEVDGVHVTRYGWVAAVLLLWIVGGGREKRAVVQAALGTRAVGSARSLHADGYDQNRA